MVKRKAKGRVSKLPKPNQRVRKDGRKAQVRRTELDRRSCSERSADTTCKNKNESRYSSLNTQPKKVANMRLIDQCIPRTGMGKAYSFQFKLQCVRWAKTFGIKPTARRAKISRNTIRSWVEKYKAEGKEGLEDCRKGPKRKPLKTPARIEKRVIWARKMAPAFGPRRLKQHFDLPCSLGAIARILRQKKLTRPKRMKAKKRHDLRELKAKKYLSLEHLQMDVKHLTDIPFYVAQMKRLNLPRYQYTVRDTKSGMLFLGYSNELSELNARVMADYVLGSCRSAHQDGNFRHIVQTDNGSEFSGAARWFETSRFSQGVAVHGAEHVYIRPGHKNAQADVESSHRLIEEEFYDLSRYKSRADFMENAEYYRLYFNLSRANYSKSGRVPWQIVHEDWPERDVASLASLISVVDLDKIALPTSVKQRGQSIPELIGLRESPQFQPSNM